jgi:hypothetical protein
MNDIGKFALTKVKQNGLIGASGHHHVFARPHQPTNELVTSDGFKF